METNRPVEIMVHLPSTLERLIGNYLANQKVDDVVNAIRTNMSIAQLIQQHVPRYIIVMVGLASIGVKSSELSEEAILQYIQSVNPGVSRAIHETPNGGVWYRQQVGDVKRLLGIG